MAKLTGAKKKAFLERMEKGRRKAKRASPPKKKAAGKNPSVRKSKKVIAKGFTKPLAAEWAAAKRAKARKAKAARKKTSSARNTTPRKKSSSTRKAAPRKKTGAHRNGRGRRNGEGGLDAAERKFEEFHGKPPGQIIEYDQLYRYPENYAEMGKLIELRFYLDAANPDFPLTRFGAAQAVCTPDGSNIYFIGGDQSVDFDSLDIASDKDFVELGPCTYICYFTVKGFHDFDPTKYWHRFGEEDKILPTLVYDRLNKALFLTSGNYRVRPEGIVN